MSTSVNVISVSDIITAPELDFSALTEEELTTLYRMVKSGRDRLWKGVSCVSSQGTVTDASAVMRDLHHANACR